MMKRNILYIFVCIPLIMLLASCSTTRKISDRDQLFIGLEKIKYGIIDSVRSLTDMLSAYNEKYGDYLWTFTLDLMKRYLGKDELTEDDFATMRERGKAAHEAWLDGIREDAEKEYRMGDIDRAVLDNFLEQLS